MSCFHFRQKEGRVGLCATNASTVPRGFHIHSDPLSSPLFVFVYLSKRGYHRPHLAFCLLWFTVGSRSGQLTHLSHPGEPGIHSCVPEGFLYFLGPPLVHPEIRPRESAALDALPSNSDHVRYCEITEKWRPFLSKSDPLPRGSFASVLDVERRMEKRLFSLKIITAGE